jgi:KEOPS complex subunit Cgi121
MLKIIGAIGEIVDIEKFLDNIKIFSRKNNVSIQIFNADLIFGKNHLLSAYEHAKRAFENKTNTTYSIEMEILLYASGERHLKLSIPKIGVKEGCQNIAIIFLFDSKKKLSREFINKFLNEFLLKRDDKVLEGDENTLKKFGISNIEIQTVSENKYGHLILEKVAMVDIKK